MIVTMDYGTTGDSILEVTTCTCGLVFAVPQRLLTNLRETGGAFYCPAGHSLSWRTTTLDDVRAQAARATARADREQARADHNEQRRAAQKAATTRARKRHAAGVCPCCQRTFKNVQRHMASQHPDFDPAEEPASR